MSKQFFIGFLLLAPVCGMAQIHNHPVAAPAYHTVHNAEEKVTPGNPKYRPETKAEPKVFICSEGKALAYHATNTCSALKSCTGQPKTIPKPNRKEGKHTACIRCYATAR